MQLENIIAIIAIIILLTLAGMAFLLRAGRPKKWKDQDEKRSGNEGYGKDEK